VDCFGLFTIIVDKTQDLQELFKKLKIVQFN